MDKTLGSAKIIDSTNIEVLLEELKKAQIADYAKERDAELEAVAGEAKRRERAAEQARQGEGALSAARPVTPLVR